MTTSYSYPLGAYMNRTYKIAVRVSPNANNVQQFAVVLFYEFEERRIEIARIDDSHDFVHFDKLYHRERRKESLDVTVWDAIRKLERNWRRYARRYAENHE